MATSAEFLDLVGATNLIPGPNSTELAIHIGHRRAGWPGLIVAGVCFILPATLIVTALAWAYVRFGQLPEASALLYGVKPVIIAIVLQALWNLGKSAVKTKLLAAMGIIAVGQFTPGPVFTTATFIGYLLSGPAGALVATVGIFLPAFIFVALSAPLIPRLRASPRAGAFLDGVNVASLALMAVVTWQLGTTALVDWLTIALALTATTLLIRWRINSAWLVLGGAGIGLFKLSL